MDNPFIKLFEKLNEIEKLVLELKTEKNITTPLPEDDLLTINEACALLHLAKPTIYFLTSQSKIPVIKKGKRLFFSKVELLEWLKSGRRITVNEINALSTDYVQKRKAFRI